MGKRSEKEIILEFIQLGKGKVDLKEQLAEELGISFSALKYKVKKFIAGHGVGRKKRSDAGITKNDPTDKIKNAFFAELAMGKSADQAGAELCLTEHQINKLSKEYASQDKFRAIRNAPQLEDLKQFVSDMYRFDIALIDAEMHGAFKVEIGDKTISIPIEYLHDIKVILAHAMQLDEYIQIDPEFAKYRKEDLEAVRVYYLKQELLQKKSTAEYAQLARVTKVNNPEKQLDLEIAFAIIDRFKPELDKTAKVKILREVVSKVKSNR